MDRSLGLSQLDVFLDIATQQDYLSVDGARPILNAEETTHNIKRLIALARWARIPTLSCVDAFRKENGNGHHNGNGQANGNGHANGNGNGHGATGDIPRKIGFSILPDHMRVESDNCLCVPLDLFKHVQQAILTKRHADPFTNPKLDRLLTEMPARRFIVFGVGLDETLRLLVLGLLLRHRPVTVIPDACGYWNQAEAEMVLRQLSAKGVAMMSTEEFVRIGLEELRPRHLRIKRTRVA